MKNNTIWFVPWLLGILFLICLAPASAQEQEEASELDPALQSMTDQVSGLDRRVKRLEDEVDDSASLSMVFFLVGVFCALWAQNTNRNPWLWFFCGLVFNVITTLVLLVKNADDKRLARGEPASGVVWLVAAVAVGVLLLGATIVWMKSVGG